MFALIIREFQFILKDKVLPLQCGYVLVGLACFELIRFFMTNEIQHGIKTLGCLCPAVAFLISAEIECGTAHGLRLRYWIVGIGMFCAIIASTIALHYQN